MACRVSDRGRCPPLWLKVLGPLQVASLDVTATGEGALGASHLGRPPRGFRSPRPRVSPWGPLGVLCAENTAPTATATRAKAAAPVAPAAAMPQWLGAHPAVPCPPHPTTGTAGGVSSHLAVPCFVVGCPPHPGGPAAPPPAPAKWRDMPLHLRLIRISPWMAPVGPGPVQSAHPSRHAHGHVCLKAWLMQLPEDRI